VLRHTPLAKSIPKKIVFLFSNKILRHALYFTVYIELVCWIMVWYILLFRMVILQESFGLGRCNVMNKHFVMHLLCAFFLVNCICCVVLMWILV
jgi:hypothetical protein